MTEREKTVAGLRELADWLEANPELKFDPWPHFNVNSTAEELPDIARRLGTCKKVAEGSFFSLRKFFGPIVVDWYDYRDRVCKKVVTGTKVIPAEPEQTIPAQPERTEEVFEWVCPDSLLAPAEEHDILEIKNAVGPV